MGMFFKDSPVAIVKCEKCCKRNIQILFFSSPNQLRDYFELPWKQCAKYEKRLVKKHKSVLFAKIGFCSRTDGMLGVDDLGESGCPRWSYGDGGSNTGYVSFTQKIHRVKLPYVSCTGGHRGIGDGSSYAEYESFTQKIYSVYLSYVLYRGGHIRMIVHTLWVSQRAIKMES